MHFGGHIGILAVIFDLRQHLRWPRSICQIVWFKVPYMNPLEKPRLEKGSFVPTRT